MACMERGQLYCIDARERSRTRVRQLTMSPVLTPCVYDYQSSWLPAADLILQMVTVYLILTKPLNILRYCIITLTMPWFIGGYSFQSSNAKRSLCSCKPWSLAAEGRDCDPQTRRSV